MSILDLPGAAASPAPGGDRRRPGPALPPAAAVEALRSRVHGPVYLAGEQGMAAEAACWNPAVVHRPAVVVGATCAADVAATVAWAAGQDRAVAVQATGHGPARAVTGDAVLISTRRMQGVSVDPVRRVARVQAGVRWAKVLAAAAEHGLAAPCGSSSDVGVVGYTLGGGVGPLARKHGFAADAVRALEIVTADGELHQVRPDEEPELFWAVRGSTSNLGIVTSLDIGLVPGNALYGGGILFAADDAAAVLHAYRAWAPALPEEVTTSVAVLRLPPLPDLPERLRGGPAVHLRFTATGLPPEDAAALLAPMRSAGRVLLGSAGPLLPTELDGVHLDPVCAGPAWEKAVLLAELTGATVDALLAVAGPQVAVPPVAVELRQLGGALARPPRVPSAVAGRHGAWAVRVVAPVEPGPAAGAPGAGRAVLAALAPWAAPGGLVTFLGGTSGPAEVLAAYPPATVERLLEVKRRVDPTGIFSFGHAVTGRTPPDAG